MIDLPFTRKPLGRLGPNLFGRPAFQVLGYAGLALAVALTQGLALATGRSPLVMAAASAAAVASFFALAVVVRLLAGAEELTHFQHVGAALAAAGLTLWALGQPILPYLDLTALGVGALAACGRLGCLMAGCCHGRPQRWGVRYGAAHAAAGFDRHLVGVPLFPSQLAESAWLALIVLAGCALLLGGAAPGLALAWYLSAYALGRFGLEFLRGDAARRYARGFSEAQWTALALTVALAAVALAGWLPWRWWLAAAPLGLLAAMLLVALARRGGERHRLLAPRHIAELAAVLGRPAAPAEAIAVSATSLGVQLSAGLLAGDPPAHHYALSRAGAPLDEAAARALAELILCLRHPSEAHELVRGGHGVYHLIVRPAAPVAAAPELAV